MTILNNGTRQQYTATSGQTVFTYAFEIFDDDDIVVYAGPTLLAKTTHYTVTGVGNENGGTIVLVSGATAGVVYTLFRSTAPERLTDFQNSGDFLAEEINSQEDRQWAVIQELVTNQDRFLQLGDPTAAPLPLDLEEPVTGQILRWKDTNTVDSVSSSNITPGGSITTDYSRSVADFAALISISSSIADYADGQVITLTGSGVRGPGYLVNSLSHGITSTRGVQARINDDWYWQRIYTGLIDVRWFEAKVDGSTVDSVFIQEAVDAGPSIINGGTAIVDAMIELNQDDFLVIGADAKLLRASATSSSTDPVVWIKGNNAVFIGSGISKSEVKTENACPFGVVRLGHKDMTESHANVNYAVCGNMRIFGSTDGGQTTGNPDVGLYRANPTIGTNLDSFFATLYSLRINSVNYGVRWQGDANADHVYNVFGQNIGNATLSAHRAMFKVEGAADISATTAFFHLSSGSDMIVIEDLDNTSNPGGKNHNSPSANTFIGMVGEQGSPGRWLVALDSNCSGQRNTFQGIDNGGGSFAVDPVFLSKNTLDNSDGSWQRRRLLVNGQTGETNTEIRLTADDPRLTIVEQDAAADNQIWQFRATSEELILRALNDAETNAGGVIRITRTAESIDSFDIMTGASEVVAGQFDTNSSGSNTRFLLYDVVTGSLQRVSSGANDSGGVGFRELLIPNS